MALFLYQFIFLTFLFNYLSMDAYLIILLDNRQARTRKESRVGRLPLSLMVQQQQPYHYHGYLTIKKSKLKIPIGLLEVKYYPRSITGKKSNNLPHFSIWNVPT